MKPSHPGLAYLYIGSAVGSFVANLLGLIMSLVRALPSPAGEAGKGKQADER